MHSHTLEPWQHKHVFLGDKHDTHERRTWFVVGLTAVTMVAEIVGGNVYGSMALTADGWHMSTHAGALTIAALAYRFSRRHAHDPRFSFGTGKLGELAAFASAIILALISLFIGFESLQRLFAPVVIGFEQAVMIAVFGLAVNLVSAWLLFDAGHHHHHHDHGEEADDHHHYAKDHNIQAVYFHVLADAMTSVLAIAALLIGKFYGWTWIDPAAGIIGALVIAHWSVGLLRSSGAVLLDLTTDPKLARTIRKRIEVAGDRVADLHLWRLGPGHTAVIVAIVADEPQPPAAYKARLTGINGLSHVTVEVHACPDHAAMPA
jgi:cation diffusion facilitator family transporter